MDRQRVGGRCSVCALRLIWSRCFKNSSAQATIKKESKLHGQPSSDASGRISLRVGTVGVTRSPSGGARSSCGDVGTSGSSLAHRPFALVACWTDPSGDPACHCGNRALARAGVSHKQGTRPETPLMCLITPNVARLIELSVADSKRLGSLPAASRRRIPSWWTAACLPATSSRCRRLTLGRHGWIGN